MLDDKEDDSAPIPVSSHYEIFKVIISYHSNYFFASCTCFAFGIVVIIILKIIFNMYQAEEGAVLDIYHVTGLSSCLCYHLKRV